jgi:hypothetical protein
MKRYRLVLSSTGLTVLTEFSFAFVVHGNDSKTNIAVLTYALSSVFFVMLVKMAFDKRLNDFIQNLFISKHLLYFS